MPGGKSKLQSWILDFGLDEQQKMGQGEHTSIFGDPRDSRTASP